MREQSDNLMMIAMKKKRRLVVPVGVGPSRGVSERARGLPRLKPHNGVPGNVTWPECVHDAEIFPNNRVPLPVRVLDYTSLLLTSVVRWLMPSHCQSREAT
jgi:hypothetical protein